MIGRAATIALALSAAAAAVPAAAPAQPSTDASIRHVQVSGTVRELLRRPDKLAALEAQLEQSARAERGEAGAAYRNALLAVRRVSALYAALENRVIARGLGPERRVNGHVVESGIRAASPAIYHDREAATGRRPTAEEQRLAAELRMETFLLADKLIASGIVEYERVRFARDPGPGYSPLRLLTLQDPSPWLPALLPWPPPRASARQVVDRQLLVPAGAARAALADVDARLRRALESAGYDDVAYYGVPGGFALVTRVEQIDSAGAPLSGLARWSTSVARIGRFSLEELIRALFAAQPGRFRLLVFIVSSKPFAASASRAELGTLANWAGGGLNILPPQVGRQPFSGDHSVTALIYEFEKAPGARAASLVVPGSLTGRAHLSGTGILSRLRRP